MSQALSVPVDGMHCASCAMTIQKTLTKLNGVVDCQVNFGNEKAKITFDPDQTNLKDLNKAIEPFGYSLNLNGIDRLHKLEELNKQRNKLIFVLPITLMVFIIMIWEIAAQTFEGFPSFFIPMEIFQVILLIISTIILFWIGLDFLKEVVAFAKYKVANMYTLVGIGTLTAYLYSALIVLLPSLKTQLNLPEMVYFDVVIVVIGFIYFGKYLEARSKLRTGEAIEKLLNLQSKTALVEIDGKELKVLIENVKVGDLIIVKPGSKIPVDGIILEGKSSIDESMITGESMPIDKTINDKVIGGTINKYGAFKFLASKVGSETLLARIIQMVDEAQGSKAPIQGLADKISAIFVPIVLIISIITLLVWIIIGSQFLPFSQALSIALLCFVGVLVIACPCALGLATPTAIIVGTGKGAENGILIKNAESLEKLHKVNIIVTDKTGTITKGEPEVSDVSILNTFLNEREALKVLATLEKNSEHPIAKAILKKANLTEFYKVSDFEVIEGKGVKAIINDEEYFAGNFKLLEDLKIDFNTLEIDKYTNQGKTPVILANKNNSLAIVTVADALKDNSKSTIQKLHKLGIKIVMLTGDNKKTADYIAKEAGIDEVIAEVLPNEKANKIKELQSKNYVVAMIGDGINDAPALAQADIGIAMGSGTDIAIESAEITLLNGDFSKVLQAIKLSKFTMSAIKQNLFWAFAYNIIGIPIAAGLLYPFFGILLNPIFAGLAMALSSVSVVSNSLRLKRIKI